MNVKIFYDKKAKENENQLICGNSINLAFIRDHVKTYYQKLEKFIAKDAN